MVGRRSRFNRKDDWNASWIWCEGDTRPKNFYLYARKSFKLPAKPTEAAIRLTADSRYKLFVNGVYVGRGPVRSLPQRRYYDTYDITPYLTKGDNVIAVLVHHLGQGTYSYIPGHAGLICEADINWDGGNEQIASDETWKVLPALAWSQSGARMSKRLGFQEVYDLTVEEDEWTRPKFRDSKWPQARVVGKSFFHEFGRLVPRQIPNLTEQIARPTAIVSVHDCPPLPGGIAPPDMPHFIATENLQPILEGKVDKPERLLSEKRDAATVKVPQSCGVSMILDFGREVFGSVELEFTRANGGQIDIGYSELLEGGRVKPDRDEVLYSDRVTLRRGEQIWCSFEPRAFRYMQLDFRDCPKPVSINHVIVRESLYPVEWVGKFESSDQGIDRIWKIAADTARLCMEDAYIDSPWRERAQWWDNAMIASRVGFYAFGDHALLAQGLRQIAASQDRDGAVSALYPSGTGELFPDFGALWVMSLWEYYTQSEDDATLADLYPSAVQWLRWIGKFADADGLLSKVRGDIFIDWAEIDRRGEVAALNCLYLGALRAASEMAWVLRHKNEAEEWAGMASALRHSISRNFWSPDRGLYADARIDGKLEEHYSKQTNILAALFEIPDHYQKASIFRQALDERGLPPLETPYFASILSEALWKSGQEYEAIELIRRKWGQMIDSGATTFWEFFTPTGSLCQGAASGPAYQLQKYVLGVRPTGERGRIRIEPHTSGLDWARGTVPTVYGLVSVDWKIGRTGLTMSLQVPNGLVAEVAAPRPRAECQVVVDGRDQNESLIEVGPGSHTVRVVIGPGPRSRKKPVEAVQSEPARPTVVVPPGRGDIEYVEQMIRILSEMERDQVLTPLRKSADRPAEKRGRSRRRTQPEAEEQPVAAEEPQAQEAAAPTEEGEARPEHRRPRRRRRRTDKPTEGETFQSEEALAQQPTAQVQPPAEAQPAEGPPRRSRRRGKKPSEQHEPAAPVAVEPKPEPEVAAGDELEVTFRAPRQRPSRRRSSGRGRGPEVHENAPQAEVAPVQDVVPIETPAAPAVEEPRQAPKRRPSRRRKPQHEGEESPAPVNIEPPQPMVGVPVESAPEPAKRPARRRRHRSHKPADGSQPAEVAAPVVETPPQPAQEAAPVESEPAPAKRPARRRRHRPHKPADGSQAAESPATPEPPAKSEPNRDEGQRNPRRQSWRPKKPSSEGSSGGTGQA